MWRPPRSIVVTWMAETVTPLKRPPERLMSNDKTLYSRSLPGGGFVHVELDPQSPTGAHRAYLAVERRTDPARREGHTPPVVASAEASTRQGVFAQLLEIAADNVAVARALLRWQSDGRARF